MAERTGFEPAHAEAHPVSNRAQYRSATAPLDQRVGGELGDDGDGEDELGSRPAKLRSMRARAVLCINMVMSSCPVTLQRQEDVVNR